jgi:hypothetical protein
MITNQYGTECQHFVIQIPKNVTLTNVEGSIFCEQCTNEEKPQKLSERNFDEENEK